MGFRRGAPYKERMGVIEIAKPLGKGPCRSFIFLLGVWLRLRQKNMSRMLRYGESDYFLA